MADVCFLQGPFFRQYGVITSSGGLNSHLQLGIPSSTNANLYTGALVAGDVKVAKDGGAEANITTLPVQIGATGVWQFALSAAELTAYSVTIHVKKTGSTAEMVITVETNIVAGQVNFNATAFGGNTAAVTLTGVGTGQALKLAATTAPYLTNLFDTTEVSEISGAPPTPPTYGQSLLYLMARFYDLVTQTVSVQTVYKRDSATALTNMAVADDGTTQSKGKGV